MVRKGVRHLCAKHPKGRSGKGACPLFEPCREEVAEGGTQMPPQEIRSLVPQRGDSEWQSTPRTIRKKAKSCSAIADTRPRTEKRGRARKRNDPCRGGWWGPRNMRGICPSSRPSTSAPPWCS